jgi:hypothetical protein
MVGDTVVIDGVEYEILWAGGEGLIEDRQTKPTELWRPPGRIYNKKSPIWKMSKAERKEYLKGIKENRVDKELDKQDSDVGLLTE